MFKVGDIVLIREDIGEIDEDTMDRLDIVTDMLDFAGKIMTIERVVNMQDNITSYTLEGNRYYWRECLLKEIKLEPLFE